MTLDPRRPPGNREQAPDQARARLRGRLFITGVLLAGLLGGWWAVSAGKRMAEERKARLKPATPATAPVR